MQHVTTMRTHDSNNDDDMIYSVCASYLWHCFTQVRLFSTTRP